MRQDFISENIACSPDKFSKSVIKEMFDGKKVNPRLGFDYVPSDSLVVKNIQKVSVSGVQEKMSAVIDGGELILTPDGRQSEYILKPSPSEHYLRYRKDMPANEHLTMQIARHIYGIDTAANTLAFFNNGDPVYIVRRFDIDQDGKKIPVEDFASLLGKSTTIAGSGFKYSGSYADIADCIRRYVAAFPLEITKFFKTTIFNYLFCNGDAHIKNFSLIQSSSGDYCLAPMYDLMNTAVHIDDGDFALAGGLGTPSSDILDRTGHPAREDFEIFAAAIGVPSRVIPKILDAFSSEPEILQQAVAASGLSEKAQRLYLRLYRERLHRFVRE